MAHQKPRSLHPLRTPWGSTARVISRLGHPVWLTCAFGVVVIDTVPADWSVTGFAIGLAAGLSTVVFWLGQRRGWWPGIDWDDRQERTRYLPLVWISGLAVWGLSGHLMSRATPLIGGLGMLAVLMLTDWLISFWWKISIHAGTAAGLTTFALVYLGSPWFLVLWLIPLAIGWSRTTLGHHTPDQVKAGWGLGLILGAAFGILARQHGT